MVLKIIFIFLVFMALIALVGRALFPASRTRSSKRDQSPPKCPDCGRYLMGRKTCDCKGRKA